MNTSSLNALFQPTSIAVVGVSRDMGSVGTTLYKNIIEYGFKGLVFPVNPFITDFLGIVCYPTVLSIPQDVDLSIVVVPSTVVPSVLNEIGKKGISTAIIISSGFGESGEEGLEREKQVQIIAEKYGITLLGPNCLGVIHPHTRINASFARTNPIPGSIAFLSQSGAMGTALLDIITPKGIGLSHFISLGNKAGLSEKDILEYLLNDDTTKVIGMYVEQLKDAQQLIEIGQKFLKNQHPKPIVVLKGGKTKEGTEAVHSHTGSMAGLPEAYTALFRQSRFVETHSTQEFINTLVCFSQNPVPDGNSSAVLTNAGGPAILATDILITSHVFVPKLTAKNNPIDLLGDAKAHDYHKVLVDLENNDMVHSIMGIVTPQAVTEIADTANAFCIHKKNSKKPLAVCWMGDQVMKEGKQILDMGHIPVSKYPEQTAVMLSNLHRYAKARSDFLVKQSETTIRNIQNSIPVNFSDPLSVIKSYGIPVANYVFVKDVQDIPKAIAPLGKLIVIKLLSKQIVHKSDAGAIRLSVLKNNAGTVAHDMIDHVKKSNPAVEIEAILCMDMVDTSNGLECIIGIKKESGLGTLVMLGVGGIFVELIHDIAFRFSPLTRFDAEDMIRELSLSPLFQGIRGKPPLDTDALTAVLLTVSDMCQHHPEITELDINPLLLQPKGLGIIALDCRIAIAG